MYEKEGHEFQKQIQQEYLDLGKNGAYPPLWERIGELWGKGAEFGYNKANEWNYVKDGIFPKDEKDILCQINFETYEVGYYHQEKRCFYTIDGREIEVIAWKEIVPPIFKDMENDIKETE